MDLSATTAESPSDVSLEVALSVPRAPPWDNDELLRAELFSIERLEQHATSLAVAQSAPLPSGCSTTTIWWKHRSGKFARHCWQPRRTGCQISGRRPLRDHARCRHEPAARDRSPTDREAVASAEPPPIRLARRGSTCMRRPSPMCTRISSAKDPTLAMASTTSTHSRRHSPDRGQRHRRPARGYPIFSTMTRPSAFTNT